jgi:Sigma-70 factor, region 1.2
MHGQRSDRGLKNSMELLQEYLTDDSAPDIAPEDREMFEPELPEHEEAAEEVVSTDDPVRVYLREMGSIRLLSPAR